MNQAAALLLSLPHISLLNAGGRVVHSLLLALFISSLSSAQEPSANPNSAIQTDSAIAAGVAWIEKQQVPDGRWPSETYGSMKSGIGTTALILESLSEVRQPQSSSAAAAFIRGQQCLISNMTPSGSMLSPDGRSDSAVYASALLLTASDRYRPLPDDQKRRLLQVLLRSQQMPAQGWPENAVGRGGWGVEPDPSTAESNPANVSVTVHALNALKTAGELSSESRKEAVSFLNRCRDNRFEPDGGFWFLPRRDDQLNKLGVVLDQDGQPRPRAYSTATCDGIISLIRLGFPTDGPDVSKAMEFLLSQPPPLVPRTPENPDDILPPLSGLYFYHAAAFASVWHETRDARLLPVCEQITKELVALQKEDGHWESPIALMREDDPLIATGLAIIALKRLQSPPQAVRPSR